VAFKIWRQCDGSRSVDAIASSIGMQHGVVEAAVELLGESGLLEAPEYAFESTVSRRRMVKLVAAGAIGAVGVPVVASITRVGPEASATFNPLCGMDCKAQGGDKCCCKVPLGNGGFNYNCTDRGACIPGNGGKECTD
jgi:hypothetical protein